MAELNMNEQCATNFYGPVSTMVVSHIPFIGTASRLRRALSYSAFPASSADLHARESTSATTSGSNTPLIRPSLSSELQLTQLDTALNPSNMRASRAGGIDWNSVMLGHQMLISASQRAQLEDNQMARVMYVDALKYLFGGLPSDLSRSERQSLQAFAPSLELESSAASHDMTQASEEETRPASQLVRSSTASIVAFLIALFMLAVPALAALVNKLLDYERRHHVAERLFSTTGNIVKTASATSFTLGGQIISLSQRQSSTYVIVSILGLVHSIVDGVNDGIERSLHSQPILSKGDSAQKLYNS